MFTKCLRIVDSFRRDRRGNVGIIFGMHVVPVVLLVGAGIDYSVALRDRAALQTAVDAAALAAVERPANERAAIAQNVAQGTYESRLAQNPAFSTLNNADGTFTVSAKATTPFAFLPIANIHSAELNVQATALKGRSDNSCILAMAHGLSSSTIALDFNGSPSVALTGCGMMSNASAECSGHSTLAPFVSAVGSVGGTCPNAGPNTPPIPDIYAKLATKIVPKCIGAPGTTTWTAGAPLPLANMVAIQQSGYLEYHVCGNLILKGTGALNTSSPQQDVVVVIENGSLTIDNGADISTSRMTLVLTGSSSFDHRIYFPNGNGKWARLSVSPSVHADNPWKGVSIYLDPNITTGLDMVWQPAANLGADGVVYLPHANLTMNGNASSSNSLCTKIVVNTLTSNGNIDFKFNQTTSACAALGVTQWATGSRLVK